MSTNKIDLVKAEIERRIAELTPTKEKIGIVGGMAVKRHLDSLLSFIDSLQEESVSEDLGEYINELSKQFTEVSFAKLSRIAVRVVKWKEQQMLAKAVDAVVKIDAGGYPYVDRTIELYDYDKDIPLAKRGDKVKILVIKEK